MPGEVDEARRCSSGTVIEVLRLVVGEVTVAERSGIDGIGSRSFVKVLRDEDDRPDLCLSRSLDLGESRSRSRSRSRTLVEGIGEMNVAASVR